MLRSNLESTWGIVDGSAYCYLLGAYLGDGTVCHQPPDYWCLRIINDRRYPAISGEILQTMRVTFAGATARVVGRVAW